MPMTQRVKSITARSLSFHLEPWLYLNNPTFTAAENVSFLSLPNGVYNFGGIKAIVGSGLGIKDAWVQVNFSEAFAVAPVVFVTQVTSNTLFPTTVHIRNVTTTGFEVC